MAQKINQPTTAQDDADGLGLAGVQFVTREEGAEMLDRAARRYFGMSGEDFSRQYKAGMLDNEEPDVIRLSFLIPLAEQ